MPKIAIATYDKLPNLTENDQLLLHVFEEKGFEVSAKVWDDPNTNWDDFDFVLIRSTWDYYLKPKQFRTWVSRFINSKTRLINAPKIVLKNSHKFYLKELADNGVSIIPTIFSSEKVDIQTLKTWQKVVVKPAISAGSHETEILETSNLTQDVLDRKIENGDWLIQPFLEEIIEAGEISMLFFGGTYSHAIQKVPKSGDFRVQKQFGAQYLYYEPSDELISLAKNIVEIAGKESTYARIDGVMTQNGFLLMEVEMIEPDLFFEYATDGPRRFVEAIEVAIKYS